LQIGGEGFVLFHVTRQTLALVVIRSTRKPQARVFLQSLSNGKKKGTVIFPRGHRESLKEEEGEGEEGRDENEQLAVENFQK